jgi:hypothetical protein
MKKLHFLTTLFPLLVLAYPVIGQAPTAEWVKTYSGYAREIFVDGQNNILVSGSSPNKRGRGFSTIKYNTNGQQLWTASYNGPGNDDYVYGLTADANGSVYITGQSAASSGTSDYATVKYDPDGNSVWVKRYNGTLNMQDIAKDVKVDISGNVYVTGFANGDANNIFRGRALVTIKYEPDGTEDWRQTFDAGGNGGAGNSIAIDGTGNIYVTGENNGGVIVLKYDNTGQLLWTRNTTGSSGYNAETRIDAAGNIVIVSGGETIKYDANGTLMWQQHFNASYYELALDASDNIYVIGFASDQGYSDYMTVKYDPNGALVWSRRFNGNGTTTGTDIGRSIALDNTGNVYVTGYCTIGTGQRSTTNYGTIKYNADGVQQWLALYPGHAYGVATDNSGNIYVAGQTSGAKNSTAFGTIKYPAGSVITSRSVTNIFPCEGKQTVFSLQNYPNPFSQSTTIEYQIPQAAKVKLTVYDFLGREITTLVNENQAAGLHRINFARNKLPAGTYIYRLQVGEFIETKKLIVLR